MSKTTTLARGCGIGIPKQAEGQSNGNALGAFAPNRQSHCVPDCYAAVARCFRLVSQSANPPTAEPMPIVAKAAIHARCEDGPPARLSIAPTHAVPLNAAMLPIVADAAMTTPRRCGGASSSTAAERVPASAN